jgi:hypothetical protein
MSMTIVPPKKTFVYVLILFDDKVTGCELGKVRGWY